MTRRLRASTALSALALIGTSGLASTMLVAPAAAQDYTTGTIVGSVRTDTGEIVTGGDVTVTSNEQGFTRTTTISRDGSFRVPQLQNGTYTVRVAPTGLPAITDAAISVSAGASNTYVFTVPTATASAGDEIVVTGQTTKANDFAANTTGLSIDVQQLIENVPVSRDLTSLILLAPGAQQGDNGFGNFASISGATVAENSYYVNGLNITNFRDFIAPSTVPFEFYRTLDVKTGGLTAEFGRALGGVTSAVTKSGSNNFQAGAVIAYSPNFLSSHSPDTYAARNSDDYSEDLDANFYVSGPIIKDRLFFYGLYAPQYSKNANTSITSLARITSTSNSPFWGAKVDAVIADGHRLEGMYFRDHRTTRSSYYNYDGTPNGTIGAFGGGVITETGGDTWNAAYTGTFAPWITVSGSYGRNERVGLQYTNPVQAAVSTTRYRDPVTGLPSSARVSGTASGDLNDRDKREQFRADVDLYFTAFGDHHVRGGFDQENLTASEATSYNAGYRYIFYSSYIRRYYYENSGSFKSRYRAFYLQDSWSLLNDRLNLQLGIRNDSFQNRNEVGDVYFEQKNQWGPRLGASFDVFGDKRTKISGFWGRYYLPVATNTNIRLAASETYYQQRFAYPATVTRVGGAVQFDSFGRPLGITYSADGSPALGATLYTAACPVGAPDVNSCASVTGDGTLHTTEASVSQGLKPSYADEWILGLSHQVDDWTFGVRYVNRRLGRTLEDVAIDKAIRAYCAANGVDALDCASAYSGFSQYVLSNPGDPITVAPVDRLGGRLPATITFDSNAIGYTKPIRNYDSVEFNFDKPFDGVWSLGGSYTYTRLRGNYEGAVISNINQTDSGLTQDYDQPGFLDGAYGDLANGRKHTFKLYGSYKPFDWLKIGANLNVASPRKFSCLGNYDTDGNPFDDPDPVAGFTPEYQYGAFSYYCSNPAATGLPAYTGPAGTFGAPDGYTTAPKLIPRGTAFESDWSKQLDVGVQFDINQLPGSSFRFDVFNVFNWKSKLDFNEFGDISLGAANPYYQRVLSYQTPRYVRMTLALRFGQ